ncbi:MAG TPA: hypothetical protein VHP61_00495 [Acidobacteriota bacterium]|nr:hypothetical protein [Acidobacteriota bacterium]
MTFFFVQDFKGRYRYFSSEPAKPVDVKFSKSKEAWELAKKKLTLLPKRTLRMEQAFERALRSKGAPLRILYAASTDVEKIRFRFASFLQRQRTRHVVVLAVEALLVPVSGLAAILPGPNIVFYALALLMITQWLALRGIGKTLRTEHDFVPDALLADWEKAVKAGDERQFPGLLEALESEHHIRDAHRILWTRERPRRGAQRNTD